MGGRLPAGTALVQEPDAHLLFHVCLVQRGTELFKRDHVVTILVSFHYGPVRNTRQLQAKNAPIRHVTRCVNHIQLNTFITTGFKNILDITMSS